MATKNEIPQMQEIRKEFNFILFKVVYTHKPNRKYKRQVKVNLSGLFVLLLLILLIWYILK